MVLGPRTLTFGELPEPEELARRLAPLVEADAAGPGIGFDLVLGVVDGDDGPRFPGCSHENGARLRLLVHAALAEHRHAYEVWPQRVEAVALEDGGMTEIAVVPVVGRLRSPPRDRGWLPLLCCMAAPIVAWLVHGLPL